MYPHKQQPLFFLVDTALVAEGSTITAFRLTRRPSESYMKECQGKIFSGMQTAFGLRFLSGPRRSLWCNSGEMSQLRTASIPFWNRATVLFDLSSGSEHA